eukprot:GHVH01010667.1.p1 GENE.GHVH01010667.1~~GHVH01010667.1.p1  ORF type:complete len:244 (-),score=22.91 GHVH01010667.1:74-766(-)
MTSPGDSHVDLYKVILIGDATVGKTHLVGRYVRGTLPKTPQATIGVEFATKTVPLQTGGTVKVQLWDTAGQERYRSITAIHYRKAVGALLVYDVTRKESFANIPVWLDELKHTAAPDVVVMLVGNKVDLVEADPSSRQVDKLIATEYANKNNLFFCETSALQNKNVKQLFEILMQEIYNTRAKKESHHSGLSGGVVNASAVNYSQDGKGGVYLPSVSKKSRDLGGCCMDL